MRWNFVWGWCLAATMVLGGCVERGPDKGTSNASLGPSPAGNDHANPMHPQPVTSDPGTVTDWNTPLDPSARRTAIAGRRELPRAPRS